MSHPPLSLVPDQPDYLEHLTVNDVIDVQTLESEAPFCGVTLTRINPRFIVVTPDLIRARAIYNEYPLLIPWRAIAWIRLGTGEESFTDPANDGPNCDEFGHPLRDEFGNRIDRSGNVID